MEFISKSLIFFIYAWLDLPKLNTIRLENYAFQNAKYLYIEGEYSIWLFILDTPFSPGSYSPLASSFQQLQSITADSGNKHMCIDK